MKLYNVLLIIKSYAISHKKTPVKGLKNLGLMMVAFRDKVGCMGLFLAW
jgi:hypothetical protein